MFFTSFDKTSATADMKVSNVFRALIKVTFDYLMASVILFQNISRVYQGSWRILKYVRRGLSFLKILGGGGGILQGGGRVSISRGDLVVLFGP